MNDYIGLTVYGLIVVAIMVVLTNAAYKAKEINKVKEIEEVKIEKVFVNDRLSDCESRGGKYGLYWSEVSNAYKEYCKVLEREITDY